MATMNLLDTITDVINYTDVTNYTNVINETMYCEIVEPVLSWFMCLVIIGALIVGLSGNALALWVFCSRMKVWKPHTVFVFNLVLADFLLLIAVPFRLNTYILDEGWSFGQVWCNINLFMLSINRSASIAFMTTLALDRYFKVVHPHHRISRMTLAQAGWLVGLIWVVVIALRIPMVSINLLHQNGNLSLCRSFGSYDEVPPGLKVHYVAFVAEFFVPWFLLLFCSARIVCHLRQRKISNQKRVQRGIQVVGVISCVFTICFMPSVFTGLVGVIIKHFKPEDCENYKVATWLFKVCIGLTYLNSALDPLIYTLSSSLFREALRSAICVKQWKRRP